MSQVRYFWSCDGVCRHWLVCHGGRHSGSVGLEQGEVEAYMRACKLVRPDLEGPLLAPSGGT